MDTCTDGMYYRFKRRTLKWFILKKLEAVYHTLSYARKGCKRELKPCVFCPSVQKFMQFLASRNTLFNLSNFLDKTGSHGGSSTFPSHLFQPKFINMHKFFVTKTF